jgi:neprosin-like protein
VSISRRRPLIAALFVALASTLALPAAQPAHAGTAETAQPLPPLPVFLPSDHGYYHDVGATQRSGSDGGFALLTVAQPYVAPGDSHSLAAVAARSADGSNNVQVGWTVDPVLNGDYLPRLFVIYRSNQTDACYNVCGFEPYPSSTIHVGIDLPVGSTKRFGIQHSGDRWWIAYDTEWIGSFPDTLWSGAFTRTGAVQYFGEVAAPTAEPYCTGMGTGYRPDSTQSARFGSITLINGDNSTLAINPTDNVYGVQQLSGTSIRFGGPGLC